MELMTGMVISTVKAPDTYNEIVRFFKEGKKKMVEVLQFSATDEDKAVIFKESELDYMLRRGAAFVVNNWESRN